MLKFLFAKCALSRSRHRHGQEYGVQQLVSGDFLIFNAAAVKLADKTFHRLWLEGIRIVLEVGVDDFAQFALGWRLNG